MNELPIKKQQKLAEVKYLYRAYLSCTDENRSKAIEHLLNETLRDLTQKNDIDASYLIWKFSCEEKQDYLSTLRSFADQGSSEAQYDLACELFEDEASKIEAGDYYAKAAKQDHLESLWCHGMNLLSGDGGTLDSKQGLTFIEQAARLKFSLAIKFMAEAHLFGLYGLSKDDKQAASWHKLLGDPDVINPV